MHRTILLIHDEDSLGGELDTQGIASAPLLASFHADIAQLTAQVRNCTIATSFPQPAPSGPIVMLSTAVPHLPLARLHDAFTHLEHGADLVVGPCDNGSWYLVGFRSAPAPHQLGFPKAGAPLAPLIALGLVTQQRVCRLPPWYRIASLGDLERLSADLRTMPADTALHTRHHLLQSVGMRVVGS